MKTPQQQLFRVFSFSIVSAMLALLVLPAIQVNAAQITNRSLTLQAGSSDGGSKPGGVVRHKFDFTVPGGSSVGSIKFKYCTTAAPVSGGLDCDTPNGLVTTNATLANESGATGFSMVNTTNGEPHLTRSAASIGANSTLSYTFGLVTNPTTTNQTFHVRISTYSSTDATGTPIDTGTVTASTATPIVLDGTMPESLVFCTGASIGLTAGVPDCAKATPGAISFNQLFSPVDTATAKSEMAASTNAGGGYAITVNGTTLTSGSNTITAVASPSASLKGISQFGMNLKANTVAAASPAIGAEIAVPSNGTNYRGQAATGYDTADTFTYVPGNTVANSYNGGAGGSDAQIYTASYIVNVPGSQPAGTYTTTLTYICTPTF